jgi:flagellin
MDRRLPHGCGTNLISGRKYQMIINHNIAALNTHRQLGANTAATSKNIEKLSSGLRINRAGDDAAGLAISEKMRGQIRGLDQASRNAQDGISLIQTAEGALNETHSILQRMRELAVQAGNGTNADSDLKEIQKEINQLTTEINRVSNTTEFNTKKLLNGGKDDVSIKTVTAGVKAEAAVPEALGKSTVDLSGLTAGQTITIDGKEFTFDTSIAKTIANISADTDLAAKYTISDATNVITFEQQVGSATATTIDSNNTGVKGSATKVTDGVKAKAAVNEVLGQFEFDLDTSKLKDGQTIKVGIEDFTFKADGTGDFKNLDELATAIAAKGVYTASSANGKLTLTQATGTGSPSVANVSVATPGQTGNEFTAVLQIGANKNQTMEIGVKDMGAKALGLTNETVKEGLEVTDGTNNKAIGSALNVLDQAGAGNAVETINKAIETVSGERSKLGAFQNRLEHTINNLGTSSENLTAAESRIRDVDMAKEMMEQTKNNILAQAAQAMLAQANQQPQGVLQLLR